VQHRYVVLSEGPSPRTAKAFIAIEDEQLVRIVAREIARRLESPLETASDGLTNEPERE
jgi:hypothetical protein